MEFLVDDIEIDSAEVRDGTIEEALRKVQADFAPPGNLVVALRCDGDDVAGEVLAASLNKPVTDFERLEVFTATRAALVTDAMDHAVNTLGESVKECQRIAELLASGQTSDGIRLLGTCLGMWQQIHEAIRKSLTMLDVDLEDTMAEGGTLFDMIEKPKAMLLEIKGALTVQDHVLLADILQYEFGEVAGAWQAMAEYLRGKAAEFDG